MSVRDDHGTTIKQSILSIPAVNPGVAVDCYVIMPDHVHLLLNLTGQYGGHPLSKVIQRFKSYTDHLYQTDGQPFGPKLWQRGYHDHILRNENDLLQVRNYIQENPLRWSQCH